MCLLTLHNDASYTISVRQYRILPCRFLQCIPHGKPPCVVLILPISFRAYKGLAPSGKKTPAQSFVLTKNSCIFEFFLLLCSRCALLMQGTHTGLASGGQTFEGESSCGLSRPNAKPRTDRQSQINFP